jgi:hypothetical protein
MVQIQHASADNLGAAPRGMNFTPLVGIGSILRDVEVLNFDLEGAPKCRLMGILM